MEIVMKCGSDGLRLPMVPFRNREPHDWLERLANAVSRAFCAYEPLAPLGCHVHRDSDHGQWEVTLFVSSTEFFGGPRDGQVSVSRFMLDLRALINTFDDVETFYWQAHAMPEDDQLGPHLGIEGQFEGHDVWLRVTATPPSQFEPGRVINTVTNQIEHTW